MHWTRLHEFVGTNRFELGVQTYGMALVLGARNMTDVGYLWGLRLREAKILFNGGKQSYLEQSGHFDVGKPHNRHQV